MDFRLTSYHNFWMMAVRQISKSIYTNDNAADTSNAARDTLNLIEMLTTSITKLQLKNSDTNLILKLCDDLFTNLNGLNLRLIENSNETTAPQVLDWKQQPISFEAKFFSRPTNVTKTYHRTNFTSHLKILPSKRASNLKNETK